MWTGGKEIIVNGTEGLGVLREMKMKVVRRT